MIPLIAHIAIFLLLFPAGVRRLLCASSLFLHNPMNPSLYLAKPWHFSQSKWKNIDFYALLIALPLASFTSLVFFFSSPDHPFPKFSFLHQSLLCFLFWVLLVLILSRELYSLQIINETLTFLIAGILFFLEYSLTGNGFMGVSRNFYDSLNNITLLCGCCCLYLSIRPRAFFADFFLSMGIVVKASWVLQTGLNLYTGVFGFKGCSELYVWEGRVKGDVKCDLEEDRLRAIAVMNLLFIAHAVGAFAVGFGILLCLSWNQSFGDGGGHLLAKVDSESLLMEAAAEVEMD